MGIAGAYRRFMELYPNLSDALKVLEDNDKLFLYFDYNGCIHPCAAKVIDRYVKTEHINRKQIEEEIFIELKRHTLEIINKLNPLFVMFAIDGVAPRAKMEQQRERRYKSVIEKRDRRKIFDTNSISPGTPFMRKLTIELNKFIKEELKPKNIKCLFLDHTKVGEGEHKIIQFIKNFKHNKKVNHVIYGLDADLIMLSLTTTLDNIYLLREKQVFEHKKERQNKKEVGQLKDNMELNYNLLPICKFKNHYWKDINVDFKFSTIISKEDFFRDFVFMWFLLGNDFLPHLKIVNVYNNGFEILLAKYLEQLKIHKKTLLDSKFKINQSLLLEMLREINENEEKYISNNNKAKYDKVIQYHKHGWKGRYYNYYLKRENSADKIQEISKNYCDILKWTTLYYFNKEGTENWSMYYKFPCAPCFSDLYEYLSNNNINDIEIPKDKPYTQNQQLMIILPPQSAFLIPRKFNHLMFGKLQSFYPKRIKLDRVDKLRNYMAAPILPEIDDLVIKQMVR